MLAPPIPSVREWHRLQAAIASHLPKLAFVCVTLLPSQLLGQGARACAIQSFPAPELCARAGLDSIRATYILLIDESGSMRPIWDRVKSSVSEFAAAVSPGDELDLRAFSGSVRRLNTAVPATAATVRDWVRTVATLPQPSGTHTDLGLALEQALAVVASAPAERQHFIYILTDGSHEPELGSAYATDGEGGWPELQRSAASLSRARPLEVAILRLSEQADAQGLLAAAIPRADVVPAMSSSQLREWFARQSRSVAVSKLALRLASERTAPAILLQASDLLRHGDRGEIELRQLRPSIDATVVDTISITIADGAVLALFPTQPRDTAASYRVFAASRPWYLPPQSTTHQLDTVVAAQVRLGPSEELERLGIPTGPLADSIRVVATIQGAGWSTQLRYWGTLLLLLLGMGLGARRLQWSRHKPRISGRLVSNGPAGASEKEIPANAGHRFELVGADGAVVAVLEARNHKGRTALFIVPGEGKNPIRVNGSALERATRILSPIRIEHQQQLVTFFPNLNA